MNTVIEVKFNPESQEHEQLSKLNRARDYTSDKLFFDLFLLTSASFIFFIGGVHQLALSCFMVLGISSGLYSLLKARSSKNIALFSNFHFLAKENKKLLAFSLVFLLAALLIQLIPLPISFLEFLSPKMSSLYSSLGASFGFISSAPGTSLLNLVWCFSLFSTLIFLTQLSSTNYTNSSDNWFVQRTLNFIIFLGFFVSLTALSHLVLGNQSYFSLYEPLSGPSDKLKTHWPFVNPNHLAVFLELVLILNLASLLTEKSRRNISFYFRCLVHLVCFTTLVLSFSSAGLILTIISQVALIGFYLRKSSTVFEPGLIFLSLIFLASTFAFILGKRGLYLFMNFYMGVDSFTLDAARGELNLITLQIIKDFPLFGVGLGGWSEVAQTYSSSLLAEYTLDYAHNDPLQAISEIGLIGSASVLTIAYVFFQKTFKALEKQPNLLLFSTCLGLLTFILHSFVDFPFHIPSLALVFLLTFFVHMALLKEINF